MGAYGNKVLWMVVKESMSPCVAGLLLKVAAVLAATRIISSLLYGVHAPDGWTLAVASLLVGTVVLVAGYIPARKAATVDPVRFLCHE
jgi:ABC-type antimicrobial peptide transport system permease subunit